MNIESFKNFMELNEVFMMARDKASTDDVVIAYKKWIWAFPEDEFDEFKDVIATNLKITRGLDDIWEFSEYAEENPDVIYGTITNDRLLSVRNQFRHSKMSTTLGKVLKELGLNGISVNFYDAQSDYEESSIVDFKSDFKTNPKNIEFYHGTCYAKLDRMLKLGIKPMDVSNFKNIVHGDKVFITTNIEKAYFHSTQCAGENDSFPVIISLKVPDPDQLILDYDVAVDLYGAEHPETVKLGYNDIMRKATGANYLSRTKEIADVVNRIRSSGENLNTKLGIFGYKGRIPSKFFKGLLIDEEWFRRFYVEMEFYGDSPETNWGPVDSWDVFSLKDFNNLKDEIEEEYNEEMEDDD